MFLFTVHIKAMYALNRIADNCCWSVHSCTVYTPVVVRKLLVGAVSSQQPSFCQLFANQFDCDLTLSLSSSVITDLEFQSVFE